MKSVSLEQLSVEPYQLPLAQTAAERSVGCGQRQGLIVRVLFAGGSHALGDAAPLPGFSHETLAQTREALERVSKLLRGARFCSVEDIAEILAPLELPSAARHGIEQALLFSLAELHNVTPAILLGAADLPQSICTNALVQTEDEASSAAAEGYRHLKLKVARGPLNADLARVARVRAAVGEEIELRLDANGRWSEDVARRALKEFESFDIALIEQPVAQLGALARLQQEQGIPLAADELCRSPKDAQRIIDQEAAKVLVIKPMICGGLLAAREIARLAIIAGLDVIVTSSLESAIGCEAALQLAAALPAPRRAAGLASTDPRWSQQPRISVAQAPGKGLRA
ncbi:MAG: o-succinylbenzoate synthase [Deltaproteobacteria bacterium]|nr:o-succinylbenzoate synthase [Deltaproteobacteria bacterium]